MPDFSGLTVDVKQTPEGSHYQVGVTVNGAFFPFGVFTATEVEARLHEAEQAAAAAPSEPSA